MKKEENLRRKKYENKNKIEPNNRQWKEKNEKYLEEIQLFFDIVDRIEDAHLKQKIISQMLYCDKVLTEIAEEMFLNYYQRGYQEAKEE